MFTIYTRGKSRSPKVQFIKVATAVILSTGLLLSFTSCTKKVAKSPLTLATTTSVNDSGLLAVLQPEFEKDTGITLKVIAQGTGQAIKTGESGDADVLFIHDKASEEKFVTDGYGVKRVELMYNYFVVVGPENDPAGVKTLLDKNAVSAFKQISEKQAAFVSRGDDSGTNKKEIELWKTATTTPKASWYISAGKGMGDVLIMTSEKQGYTLTDKATFLSMKDKLDLEIVLDATLDLKNQYTIIAVNPAKIAKANKDGAQEFINWMTSKKALRLIEVYGKDKYGEALFTVDYKS